MITRHRETSFPAYVSDYLPTFLELLGQPHPQPSWPADGISLLPLIKAAQTIEDGVKKETGAEQAFMTHPIFGCLTCCPSNIGTGMRGSVHILVPKLIKTIGFDAIDKMARERNCQARGSSGEHSEVVDRIDVSNWRRIGFPEWQLVDDMIACANFLAAEEDKVPDDA